MPSQKPIDNTIFEKSKIDQGNQEKNNMKSLDILALRSFEEMEQNMTMNDEEIVRFLDKHDRTFFSLLKTKPNFDELKDVEKK
jgi:hypothetical protein